MESGGQVSELLALLVLGQLGERVGHEVCGKKAKFEAAVGASATAGMYVPLRQARLLGCGCAAR